MKRRFWLSLLLGLSLVMLLASRFPFTAIAQSAPPPPAPSELRGVWLTNIDSDVLFSRRTFYRALRRLHRLNFNTIYPTVWNWGYTLYPSPTAGQVIGQALDPTPGLQGRDMLAEAVDRGHQLGLTVIPWFEFGFMAPADSELARRHPDWLTNRRDGSRIVMEGEHPRVWLNPFHPDVQQFILALISELVEHYDIDGLQLDDHFGLPVELGYDPYTIQQYKNEHQGKAPPDNVQDPEWKQWRANKITDVMKRVFYTVKSHKPDCIVAIAPNSKDFSYNYYLQDWATWERQGFVEELILQVYRDDLSQFTMELERPEVLLAKAHIPVGVGILAGLKNRSVSMNQIRDQIKLVRDRQFAGVSFFFYETLGDRDADYLSLFPAAASRPTIVANP